MSLCSHKGQGCLKHCLCVPLSRLPSVCSRSRCGLVQSTGLFNNLAVSCARRRLRFWEQQPCILWSGKAEERTFVLRPSIPASHPTWLEVFRSVASAVLRSSGPVESLLLALVSPPSSRHDKSQQSLGCTSRGHCSLPESGGCPSPGEEMLCLLEGAPGSDLSEVGLALQGQNLEEIRSEER